ncbi:hypothetical protein TrCOL_g8751 [Triparma columacea]|uniref:deoxyribose-phosphate aldolase n=1 Tax=Triparma columacea TaxID=722753 RepID=A0A9W7L3U1_9STRA|nr:hypothetical protein TrCOL_g8751 [Triparma columacea]
MSSPLDYPALLQSVLSTFPLPITSPSSLLPPPSPPPFPSNVATIIDHTFLSPTMTTTDLERVCNEAIKYNFASVCIPPTFVPDCASLLKGSNSLVCTVVGFPNGYAPTPVKKAEASWCVDNGADEVDMVCNMGLLKTISAASEEGDKGKMRAAGEAWINDVLEVVEGAKGRCVKCIIEAGALTDEEVCAASLLFRECRVRTGGKGPEFIKTSTGFNGFGGATERDVEIMGNVVRGGGGKVKASGGVGSLEQAKKIVGKGAERIGASKGVKIVEGCGGGEGGY